MFQDNPLLAQLKQQIKETLPTKEGTIKATDKGFGFLEVDSKTSFFIPPPYMKKCMHGDKVEAIIRTENEKEVAEPDKLIEPSLTRFIGRIKMFKGRLNVVPDHPQLKKLSLKAKAKKGLNPETLSEGDWVVAHLTRHPLKGDNTFFVEISEKITDANDKIAPWWVTLAENDLPNSEPAGIDNWELKDDGDLERVDMTSVPFVTIDGESTKDMDDALFAKKNENGDFELTIAIADPTAYITPDDEMDKVARDRGFTIYLPGRNIPMLPRDLADDLCSLMENEVRPALCCTVTIAKDGVIGDDIKFFAANIQSHARLVYDHVSDWLETGSSDAWQPDETIAQVVKDLHEFAQARANWREENAVVFPDRPDYRFELSEDNDVVAIHADLRRTANRLVEESMITANICAGKALKSKFETGVFNTHAGFKGDKMADVLELINKDNEQPFTEEQAKSLEGFSAIRRWLGNQETSYMDNRIRKYQAYSEIGNQPLPHYAMGLDIYATWTSPIRKYGDMINHRMLKALILDKEPVQKPDDAVGEELALHRKHHKIAERNVGDWLYARTLINAPKDQTRFQGEIFDVNRAGARIRILENGASAFIPSSQILDNKERIECNSEVGQVLIDKNVEWQLGDVLEVILIDVNLENRSLVAKPTKEFGTE
ncbi:Exoribonuclease 2 [Vibrio nigripulchritudo SFn27]|uniref:Exoribonuclease 2 n=1 Tax=Vibrio nigripulchritudo TaxID=28173 RepID=U4KH13_9VIBR|nr:exoribonuclease II [Vibrio nigripulchritudo]CCN81455.1 Exoribonuclease 2 [Vibrio nigripulchritudo BLFn1]CCN91551.1 Exoribonuclease 2 [Vibrio nigripulchritudo SFn27]CCO38309.1 Exoribonuclease 2 [Vibrio nigripulchritudo SFn135]CCO53765.1 Exoribonuclease 2 [Vibrio nigripulchritudo Wn13]CCO60849.1 Exoribonuclease 2 [Vibrio nigripulchritudo]